MGKDLKEVSMYLKGSHYCLEDNRGAYCVSLVYKQHTKILKGEEQQTNSANRMMLVGLLKATESLKEACHIKIYAPTSLGFKKPNKSINYDLLKSFLELCESKGHTFEFYELKN